MTQTALHTFWKYEHGVIATPQQRSLDEDCMYLLHDKYCMRKGKDTEDPLAGRCSWTEFAPDMVRTFQTVAERVTLQPVQVHARVNVYTEYAEFAGSEGSLRHLQASRPA